ncbi:hypothetical protein CY35_14G101400 [Sphagnum magellanicum]|nr:hypothetical protein CY35_14G101400 [Sphagnum magellanicum]
MTRSLQMGFDSFCPDGGDEVMFLLPLWFGRLLNFMQMDFSLQFKLRSGFKGLNTLRHKLMTVMHHLSPHSPGHLLFQEDSQHFKS